MTAIPAPPEYDPNADLTPPHFLDPDPQDSTNCKVCGDVNGYGVLHLTEPVELVGDVPDRIPTCPDCTHYAHDRGPCRVLLSRFPKRTCECRGTRAA